ncbi:MAG: radical SAM protein [Pseudomonadota bacterium]
MQLKPGVHISPKLFQDGLEPDEAKRLFSDYVELVVIEIFSYCNRRCTYCPVSKVDRLSQNSYMKDELFFRVIDDLKEIQYNKRICLNLYNEPMADPVLYERIETIHKHLPEAYLYFNTNGDYLNEDNMKLLSELGVSEITVTLHHAPGADFDDREIFSRYTEFAARIRKRIRFVGFKPGKSFSGVTSYKDLKINVIASNYSEIGVNRGGTVEIEAKVDRQWPCRRPFSDFTIYYDGSVFPCCQFFPDLGTHDEFRADFIRPDRPIYSIFTNSLMSSFRHDLFAHGPKKFPCNECGEALVSEQPDQIRARADMKSRLTQGEAIVVSNFSPNAIDWRTNVDE